jgi:hypothetical protein
VKPTFRGRFFLFFNGENNSEARDECGKKGDDQTGWALTQRPMKRMADNEPKQKPRPEPQQGSKRVTKNGGYTIPAQMF